jgi:hypothetical protein
MSELLREQVGKYKMFEATKERLKLVNFIGGISPIYYFSKVLKIRETR